MVLYPTASTYYIVLGFMNHDPSAVQRPIEITEWTYLYIMLLYNIYLRMCYIHNILYVITIITNNMRSVSLRVTLGV